MPRTATAWSRRRRRPKHGLFCSAAELQAAIHRFVAEHYGTEAKPLVWCADPHAIIARRRRGFHAPGALRRASSGATWAARGNAVNSGFEPRAATRLVNDFSGNGAQSQNVRACLY